MALNDPRRVVAEIQGAASFADAVMRVRDLVQRRVLRPALTAAMKVVRDGIRDEVPQKYAKNIRRLVGSRVKSNKATGNLLVGTAGPSVGVKRGAKAQARLAKVQEKRGSGNRPGVGISAANVHWFMLGTEGRYTGIKKRRQRDGLITEQKTGNPIAYRGRIDPEKLGLGGAVQKGLKGREEEAIAVLEAKLLDGIQKEADREFKRIAAFGVKQAVKAAK